MAPPRRESARPAPPASPPPVPASSFPHVPIGLYRSLPDGTLVDINPAFAHILGYTDPARLIGANAGDLWVEPEQRRLWKRRMERQGVVEHFDLAVRRADGTVVWVRDSARVVRDAAGAVLHYEGAIEDVTALRATETALRESEDRYRDLVEHARVLLCVHTLDGRLLSVNRFTREWFGVTGTELEGTNLRDHLPPEYRHELQAYLDEVRTQGSASGLMTIQTATGERRTAQYHNTLRTDGVAEPVVRGLAFDVTETRRLERSLRRRIRQQEVIAELGACALRVADLDELFDRTAELVATSLGADFSEILELSPDGESFLLRAGRGWQEGAVGRLRISRDAATQAGHALTVDEPVVVPNIATETRFDARALLTECGVQSGASAAIRLRDGTFGVLGVHSRQPREFSEDDVDFVQSVAHLLAQAIDRGRMESALEERQRRLDALFRQIGEAILIFDESGELLDTNPHVETLFGTSDPERLANTSDFVPSESEPLLREFVQRLREDGTAQCALRLRSCEGRSFPARLRAVRVELGARSIFQLSIEDATEHTQLEEQRRLTQKMEAVGRIAGGVAHDFNNLMTVITGYSELALRRLSVTDPLRLNLEQIKQAGERATALTRQLLAFSRRQVLRPRTLDLNDLVRDLAEVLSSMLGEDIELELELEPHSGATHADPEQIEQVLVNLLLNARDAMPQGGTITISTAEVTADAALLGRCPAMPPGRYVRLRVTDTGEGISDAILPHIFDPFFSSRQERSGLGLSTAYGIVKQSGGFIFAESSPGEGATFSVYLPVLEERRTEPNAESAAATPTSGGRTILLVEDEAPVRQLVLLVLRNLGYEVIEAENGADALELVAGREDSIDLLLSDVVMPGMGSQELTRRLKERRPDLKAIYMSGYSEEAIARHGALGEDAPFLEKPFTPDVLLEKIRQVLGDAPRDQTPA